IKSTPQRIIAEGTDWRFLKCQEKNSRRDRPRKDNLTILHAADSLPVLLRCADCKPTIAAPVAQPAVSTRRSHSPLRKAVIQRTGSQAAPSSRARAGQ